MSFNLQDLRDGIVFAAEHAILKSTMNLSLDPDGIAAHARSVVRNKLKAVAVVEGE